MSKILQAEDTISGAEGYATMVVDGRVVELMELTEISATVNLHKSDVRTLGKRSTGKKTTGWDGTGALTVYMIRSLFTKMIINYAKTGKLPKFDINITNADEGSIFGKQVSKLSGCSFDSVDVAKLNTDGEPINQSLNFTFEDVELLEEFDEV